MLCSVELAKEGEGSKMTYNPPLTPCQYTHIHTHKHAETTSLYLPESAWCSDSPKSRWTRHWTPRRGQSRELERGRKNKSEQNDGKKYMYMRIRAAIKKSHPLATLFQRCGLTLVVVRLPFSERPGANHSHAAGALGQGQRAAQRRRPVQFH